MSISTKIELIYPELSYQINGCAFKIHNKLGYGHLEKVYQKALKIEFEKEKFTFVDLKQLPVIYSDQKVSTYVPDFLIEDKIVIDLKRSGRITPEDYEQLKRYLRRTGYKLGLIIHFGSEGVISKRVLNLY